MSGDAVTQRKIIITLGSTMNVTQELHFKVDGHFRIKRLREVSRIFLVISVFVFEEVYSVCLLVSSI